MTDTTFSIVYDGEPVAEGTIVLGILLLHCWPLPISLTKRLR